jgi:hypothetical protein
MLLSVGVLLYDVALKQIYPFNISPLYLDLKTRFERKNILVQKCFFKTNIKFWHCIKFVFDQTRWIAKIFCFVANYGCISLQQSSFCHHSASSHDMTQCCRILIVAILSIVAHSFFRENLKKLSHDDSISNCNLQRERVSCIVRHLCTNSAPETQCWSVPGDHLILFVYLTHLTLLTLMCKISSANTAHPSPSLNFKVLKFLSNINYKISEFTLYTATESVFDVQKLNSNCQRTKNSSPRSYYSSILSRACNSRHQSTKRWGNSH